MPLLGVKEVFARLTEERTRGRDGLTDDLALELKTVFEDHPPSILKNLSAAFCHFELDSRGLREFTIFFLKRNPGIIDILGPHLSLQCVRGSCGLGTGATLVGVQTLPWLGCTN